MRGHIRKRGSSWALVVEMGRDPQTGKRRQQWRTVHGTKKDAERELRELMQRIEGGGFVKPSRLTLGAFLERWLEDYADTNTAPRTAAGYRGIIGRYLSPQLGSIGIEKLSPQHVQGLHAWMIGRGLSPRTVLHTHRVLREALGHAVKWGLLVRNVAQLVDPPRPFPREMNALDGHDAARLLASAPTGMLRTLFTLALYTGMRRGEILGLRWQDIDFDVGALYVRQTLQRVEGRGVLVGQPKTPRSRRRIALSPDLVTLLRRHKALQASARLAAGPAWIDSGWVFTRPDGRSVDPNEISRAFAATAKVAGTPQVRFHDLRHTHATLMLSQGVHPKIVSERLGHASITITLDTYSHVLPGLQEAAALAFEENLRRADVRIADT